jgi:superfamily II DNA/RNA helicase
VAREKALAKFREDKIQVLVATDVAARGIDVAGVSHVINYTCPEDDKTYVHRIGRTGRAGASGIAITLVDATDVHRWKMINKALDLPFDEPVETYSTSPHLFTDQGIPEGTKGRIAAPKPAERREPRGSREGGERHERHEGGERSSRPRNRNRSRTRTRSGQPVAGEQASGPSGASGEQQAASGEGGERPAGSGNRRRRRRSGGGSKPAAPADA